jgi:deoxyribose-phosphate aldolase
VKIATVIGFHEGSYPTASKIVEATAAVEQGAHELDVVLNRSYLINGEYTTVFGELSHIRAACPKPTALKLIFETSQLTSEQVVAASVLAWYADFEWIKTSTGYVGAGATEENVKTMAAVSRVLGPRSEQITVNLSAGKMMVKASGGVRSWESVQEMVSQGAERIGTSSGIKIVKEATAGDEAVAEKVSDSTKSAGEGY